jgi:hypothetical protein
VSSPGSVTSVTRCSRSASAASISRPVRTSQPVHLLGERRLRALRGQAAEPPDDQADDHLAAARSGVQQPPLIAAVNPPRQRPATRAPRRRGGRPRRDPDRPARPGNLFYLHACQVGQQRLKGFKIARRTCSHKPHPPHARHAEARHGKCARTRIAPSTTSYTGRLVPSFRTGTPERLPVPGCLS